MSGRDCPHIPARVGMWLWLASGAAFAGVVLTLRLLAGDVQLNWGAAGVLVVWVAALAITVALSGLPVADLMPRGVFRCNREEAGTPLWLVAPAALATVMAASRRLDAGSGPVGWEVGAPWLIGIALFGLAAWWPALRRARPPSWLDSPIRALVPGIALGALALLTRILWPGRYPSVIDGDEGQFLQMAGEARSGAMVNPFATGWVEIPNLYPAVTGYLTWLTGTSIAGYRAHSALVGTLAVVATWRFARRVIGEPAAIAGAALLAALPFHLYFSRLALSNVTDPAALVLSLLFLWRAVHEGRRGDAWLAGVMVGLGWYGYWGARVFPAIILLLLAIAATDRAVGIRRAIVLGTWATVGFLATTAPLLMSFVVFPPALRGRFEVTSLARSASWREDPGGTFRLLLDNVWESALLPFVDNTQIFYRHPAPFLGWPIAILIAAGLGAWLAALIQTRAWRTAAWLLVPWAVVTVGVATTYPVQPQRLMAVSPWWALAAGSGLVLMVRWVTDGPIRVPRAGLVRPLLVVGLVTVLAIGNLRWYMSDERLLETYGDTKTFTAWDIGWRRGEAGAPVLLAGPPYMHVDWWANMTFLAPGTVLTSIDDPIEGPSSAPPLPPGTILVLVPERSGEQCAILRAYPGATMAEVRTGNGTLLYLAFSRGDTPGWVTATSPAGTTWTEIAPPACDTAGPGRGMWR